MRGLERNQSKEQIFHDAKKCPQCESLAQPRWDKFKDLESDGNYFTLEFKYCPCCKYLYYSDIDFS